jgi:hypothetical protein
LRRRYPKRIGTENAENQDRNDTQAHGMEGRTAILTFRVAPRRASGGPQIARESDRDARPQRLAPPVDDGSEKAL